MIAAVKIDCPKGRSLRVFHDVHGRAHIDDRFAVGRDARVGSEFKFEYIEKLQAIVGNIASPSGCDNNARANGGDDRVVGMVPNGYSPKLMSLRYCVCHSQAAQRIM